MATRCSWKQARLTRPEWLEKPTRMRDWGIVSGLCHIDVPTCSSTENNRSFLLNRTAWTHNVKLTLLNSYKDPQAKTLQPLSLMNNGEINRERRKNSHPTFSLVFSVFLFKERLPNLCSLRRFCSKSPKSTEDLNVHFIASPCRCI